MATSELVVPVLIEEGVAAFAADDPVLFRRHLVTEVEADMIVYDVVRLDPTVSYEKFEVLEPVGKCAYMPEVEGKAVREARSILEQVGIHDYIVSCPAGHDTCEDFNIFSQHPLAYEEKFYGQIRTMVPISEEASVPISLAVEAPPVIVVVPDAMKLSQAVPVAAPYVQEYFDQGFYLASISAWDACTIDSVLFYGVNTEGLACSWSFNVSKPPPDGVFLGTTFIIKVTTHGVEVEELSPNYLSFRGNTTTLPGSNITDSDRASEIALSLCALLDTDDRAIRFNLFPPGDGEGWQWGGNAYKKSAVRFDAITGQGGGCLE